MEEQDIEEYYREYKRLKDLIGQYIYIRGANDIKILAKKRTGSQYPIDAFGMKHEILDMVLCRIRKLEAVFVERGIVVKTFIVPSEDE